MSELLNTPYVVINRMPGFRVIRFKRLAASTPSHDAIHHTMKSAVAALDTLDRSQFGLLLDMREAPIRLDPDFETILAMYRPKFLTGFMTVAILARTSVGKLQLSRMGREDGIDFRIFDDEGEALSYLAGVTAKLR